jgi:hypothetical protein
MTPPEETYLKLTGRDGYNKVASCINCILMDTTDPLEVEQFRSLFFLAVLNAFYRGQNEGIAQAHEALTEARRGEKSV